MADTASAAIYHEELESAVIGSLLIDPYTLDEIEFLRPEDFYLEPARHLYAAIRDLANSGQGVDMLTIWRTIEARGLQAKVGGLHVLTQYTNSVPTSLHIETYARGVQRDAVRRHALETAQQIARLAMDDGVSVADLIGRVDRAVKDVQEKITHERYGMTLAEAFADYADNLAQRLAGGGDEIPTHIPMLNYALGGGLARGEYAVLGAPPGRGKSTFGGQLALYAAATGKRVLVFSLEMTPRRWAEQVMATALGLNTRQIRSDSDVAPFFEQAGIPMHIVHEPYLSADRIPYIMRVVEKQLGGLDLVIFDHLAYINHNEAKLKMNRTQAIGITNKTIIRALDGRVACLMLTQLNRENRVPGQRPTINAFRDSGEIEQDARAVILLHTEQDVEQRLNDINDRGPFPMTCILAKNNAGATMDIPLIWHREIKRMLELAK